jgi:tetratricopeptide (TPR) repeat protein
MAKLTQKEQSRKIMTQRHYNIFRSATLMFCLLCATGQVSAQIGTGGTESNLSKGYGARAMGLGNAFTALADDPTAVYWNPAGLEFVYQQSATFFHMSLFEGVSYDFLGYAYPTVEYGSFGLGIGRIGVGDIPQRDESGVLLPGGFSFAEYQIYLSYAKRLPYNITPGLTIRFARRGWSGIQGAADLVDTGIGADIGVMYKPEWFGSMWYQDWSFGLNIHNFLSPRINEGLDSDVLPLTIRLGLFKKIRFVGGESFDALIDFDYSERRDLRLHIGTAYQYRDLGEVRLGYQSSGITFGAGVVYNMFRLDYAFGSSEYSDVFPASHRISLTVEFGMNRTDMMEIAEQHRIAEQERMLADMREMDRIEFVNEHLQMADTYYKEAKFLDAIVEYRQVVERDSGNTYAQMMLDSTSSLLQARMDKTQAEAVQAALDKERIQNDLTYIDQHFNRGRQYLNQNNFEQALNEFNVALERDRTNRTVINAIATTRRRIREEAQRLVTETRQYMENENYAEALVAISEARKLRGVNAATVQLLDSLELEANINKDMQRGILLYQIQEYDKAYTVFEGVLSLAPDNVEAQEYLEKCKIETLGREVKMEKDTEQRYLEGVTAFLEGDYNKAIEIWEKILVEQPYNKKILKAIQGAKERKKNSKK